MTPSSYANSCRTACSRRATTNFGQRAEKVGWAKAHRAVPPFFLMTLVGTLPLCPPYNRGGDLSSLARRENSFPAKPRGNLHRDIAPALRRGPRGRIYSTR